MLATRSEQVVNSHYFNKKKIQLEMPMLMGLWGRGMTVKEIAQEMSLSMGRVKGRLETLRKKGLIEGRIVSVNRQKYKIAEEDYEELIRLWNSGMSELKIAEEMEVSQNRLKYMRKRLRDRGLIKPRPNPVRRYEE
jgi:Mn-dependent DtxR family transcriptional regulator